MRVRTLEATDFRSWARASLELEPGRNLLVGPNGVGKTNLLEAVHLLAFGRTARGGRTVQSIRRGAERFVVRAQLTDPHREDASLAASCGIDGSKEVRIDGEPGHLFSRLVGRLPLVGLAPEDLELVRGAPEERRRFLDALACQLDPASAVEELRRAQRVLRQRNAWLRSLPPRDPAMGRILTEQWADTGSRVAWRRLELVSNLTQHLGRFHHQLSGGSDVLDASVDSSGSDIGPQCSGIEEARTRLAARLHHEAEAEIQARTSLAGPHRDDLLLLLDSHPARLAASQGQARSIAVSLRLAAAQQLSSIHGTPPLLLLDDVFAELDTFRRSRLAEMLPAGSQALLASPHGGDLPFAVDRTFRIQHGQVEVD